MGLYFLKIAQEAVVDVGGLVSGSGGRVAQDHVVPEIRNLKIPPNRAESP